MRTPRAIQHRAANGEARGREDTLLAERAYQLPKTESADIYNQVQGAIRGAYDSIAQPTVRSHIPGVIRIAISQAAFNAIAATLPLGSVGYENETNERGERLIWLRPDVIAKLKAMRGPGESYSDAILRVAKG